MIIVFSINSCGKKEPACGEDYRQIGTEKYGYYHATNEGGYISWYDLCCEAYKQYGLKKKVIPVTTEEYGLSIAKRPFNSRLDKSKLREAGFEPLPDWRDAVKRYLEEAQF